MGILIAAGWGDVNWRHIPPGVMAMAEQGQKPPTRKQWNSRPAAPLSFEERSEIQRRARLEKVSPARRSEIARMGGQAAWGDRNRAQEIRELLAKGMRSCEIARRLRCAPASVCYQRKLLGLARKNQRRA